MMPQSAKHLGYDHAFSCLCLDALAGIHNQHHHIDYLQEEHISTAHSRMLQKQESRALPLQGIAPGPPL